MHFSESRAKLRADTPQRKLIFGYNNIWIGGYFMNIFLPIKTLKFITRGL